MPTTTVRPTSRPKIEYIPLSCITNKFDVRTALDQDRVQQFAVFYQSGVNMPPAEVVKLDDNSYAWIDGRTRGAARAYLNLEEMPCVVYNGSLKEDPVELYARALQANWGGSKPPSRDEIALVVGRMIELGASQKTIRDRLSFIPTGAAQAYIAWAKSVLHKRRMAKALDDIADGLSLAAAAETNKVKPELLKKAISGKRGNWGAGRSDETQFVVSFKQYISKVLFSANSGIGKKTELMLIKVESGDLSIKAAEDCINAWEKHLRNTTIRIKDWQARAKTIRDLQERAVAAPAVDNTSAQA